MDGALIAVFAVVNCSAYAVPWLVPVASTVLEGHLTAPIILPLQAAVLDPRSDIHCKFCQLCGGQSVLIFGTIAPYRALIIDRRAPM